MFDPKERESLKQVLDKHTITFEEAEKSGIGGTGVMWNDMDSLKPPTVPSGPAFGEAENGNDNKTWTGNGRKHSKHNEGM